MERMAFLAGPYMRAVVMLLATLKGRRWFIASPSPRRCIGCPSADRGEQKQILGYAARNVGKWRQREALFRSEGVTCALQVQQ
jgi:hypothetical protein